VGICADGRIESISFTKLSAPEEILQPERLDAREELRLAIIMWTESTYHRRRRQPRLVKLTLIEYELIVTQQQPSLPKPNLSPKRAADPNAATDRASG